MAVMRLGYAHVRVTDLAEAKDHYANTMGLYETLSEGNKVYYKAWDEWDHHSVVLEEGGVGLVKFGFKVEYSSDIDEIEKKAQTFGVTVERMSKGENPEVGDGIRFTTPSDHVFEVYHEARPSSAPRSARTTRTPSPATSSASASPPSTTRSSPPRTCGMMDRLFTDVFGFYATERVQTSLDDDADIIATWMTNNNQIHQLAVLAGPQGKLHHFAFKLGDWTEVGRAADLFSMDDVPIDVGPTRHGITRGQTVYFFDPSGNRNEVFAGGYLAYPDRPMNVWTPDALGKGVFYHARELNDAFTSVLT
jgi:catechol 2,3-dioxygenase